MPNERDMPPVRRERRANRRPSASGELSGTASLRGNSPDVRAPLSLVSLRLAVGDKRDRLAVGRPRRLVVVRVAVRYLLFLAVLHVYRDTVLPPPTEPPAA